VRRLDDQRGKFANEWFVGGLVVGEGSFFIAKTKFHGRYTQYRPMFRLSMQDEETMAFVAQAFKDWGLAFYWYTDQGKMAKRPCYHIFVNGHKRVLRVLDKLEPYLMGAKAHSASLVRQFIEERAKSPMNTPYSEEVLAIYEQVKAANGSRGVR